MNMTVERGKIGVRSRQSARGLRLGLLGLACLAAVSVAASAQTKEVVLHNFCSLTNCADGAQPGGVILDSEGNLYGGTLAGGAHGKGVAYKLAPSGQETVLYNFCSRGGDLCTDGWAAGVSVLDSEGNLYGTAGFGGAHNVGAVYKLTASGQETVLHSFCSLANCADGSAPSGGLIRDSEGNLYGTTLYGGASSNGHGVTSGAGVVYKVDTSGSETVLYNFCSLANCADGEKPGGVIRDSEGNLYGSASDGSKQNPGNGLVYELPTSGSETVLCSFGSANCPDGAGPSGVIMDSEGNLYGTTSSGGANGGGIVFKLEP